MENTKDLRACGSWFGRVALSLVLAATMVGVPASAFAVEPAQASTVDGGVSDAYAWAGDPSDDSLRAASSLPAKFDPRDEWVTPVKFQNPWSSCWAFSIAGASEMSILSEAKEKGIDIKTPDISEHHLAWFTYTPLPDDDDSDQGGEGMVSMKAGSQRMNSGGMSVFGTSLFSSGLGPVPEEDVPYRGKEGTIVKDEFDGQEVDYYYSPDDDWSVDEKWRFYQAVEIEESYQLPSPGSYSDAEGYNFEGLARANEAIKQQLYAGRGVSISFMADQSRPNQVTNVGYMNPGNNATKTWAHYTYDNVGINHAVTIVGWDDDYSKENFGNPDPETGVVDPDHQPPANGAWIVKNSWGSTGEFPNGYPGGWGTDGSGYFYLSYYDKSVIKPEAFDFDVESLLDDREYYSINQYDYMPSTNTQVDSSKNEMHEANVFTSGAGETVRKITCETTRPNMQVTYEVYHLDKDAKDPTQGKKIATLSKEYEFGGFHTVDLGDQAFSLPAGERYSVVVTQKCKDDGEYYVSYDMGFGEATVEQIRKQNHDQYYAMIYARILESLENEVWEREYNNAIYEGKSEDEAKAVANAYVEAHKTSIEESAANLAEEEVEGMTPGFYFNGVVNPGESYIFASPASDPGAAPAWRDFSEDAKAAKAEDGQMDNFPIKTYSYVDTALEEDLEKLEGQVESAKKLIETAVASKDGSDVDKDKHWVPTDVYNTLQEQLKWAQEQLESKDPTQLNIERANKSLEEAIKAFETARKPGTRSDVPEAEGVAMLRLYNPYTGEHLFTSDANERDTLVPLGWKYEGEAWKAPESGQEVYRLYNPNTGEHHYTLDTNEYKVLQPLGWKGEGVFFHSDKDEGTPIYRLFNSHAAAFTHHYTADINEYDVLRKMGWTGEHVGWYGLK